MDEKCYPRTMTKEMLKFSAWVNLVRAKLVDTLETDEIIWEQ